MNFIKKAFSAMGVLCLALGVCSVVNATRNNQFKAIVMGDIGSEKSEVCRSLLNLDRDTTFGKYDTNNDSGTIVTYCPFMENSECKIQIMNTPSQPTFPIHYIANSHIGLVVYKENTLAASVNNVFNWIANYTANAGNNRIILVAYQEEGHDFLNYDNDIPVAQANGLDINHLIGVAPSKGEGIRELRNMMADMCL